VDLRWTAHPAKQRPRDVALVASVVLLSTWLVLITLESAYLAALAAVILVVSVAPFLAPTRYRVDDEGVEERRLGRRRYRAWRDLRRAQVGPGAALLSPFARPHWLERYRGLMLHLDGLDDGARAQVIAAVREKIPAVS
jgi:hypothetical protein